MIRILSFLTLLSLGQLAVSATEPLTHPENVRVPDELADCEILIHPSTEKQIVIFPKCTYLLSHYDGWQECLIRLSRGTTETADLQMGPVSLSVFERYTVRGLEDGFNACKQEFIRKISAGEDSADLARAAKSAIILRTGQPHYGFRRSRPQKKND